LAVKSRVDSITSLHDGQRFLFCGLGGFPKEKKLSFKEPTTETNAIHASKWLTLKHRRYCHSDCFLLNCISTLSAAGGVHFVPYLHKRHPSRKTVIARKFFLDAILCGPSSDLQGVRH